MRDYRSVPTEPPFEQEPLLESEPHAESTVVYTDGACLGNPGPGGWAWAVPGGDWACGADPATTNQRMELQAALEALREIDGPVEVVSDSTYVVNCFRDRWYEGWLRRGWRTSQKTSNQDLWEPRSSSTWAGGRTLVPVGEGPFRRRVERNRRPLAVGLHHQRPRRGP